VHLAAGLVVADPAAGLVEQGVGEQDLVAEAVALGSGVDDREVGLLTEQDQPGGALGGCGRRGGLGRGALPQGRRVEDRSGGAAAATEATPAPASTARTGANANILRRMVGLFSG
jgi:hypothetical protein